jgi:mono/diheme cytochrome c family protein
MRTGITLQTVLFGLALMVVGCSPNPAAPEGAGKENASGDPSAPPVDPAVYRGAAVAAQVCAQCHDVSGAATAGQTFSAPSFTSVANRPDMTAAKLETWLTSLHPSMPNYAFSATAVKDLVAYVMSLRQSS